MFKKNHPYMFFIIVVTSIICITIIIALGILYQIIPKNSNKTNGNIGIIKIDGLITDSEKIVEALKIFNNSQKIKAIILRINSPGGFVAPSQEIYSQVKKVAKQKPIIASFANIATSGGYYISLGASKIITNPGTLTGSIGVIMNFTNIKKLMDKFGLQETIIKSGQYKDIGSSSRQMTDTEETLLQDVSDDIHSQFISDLIECRNIETSHISYLTDGRIFTGKQALDVGLVDQLGTFEDAVECAADLASITRENIIIVHSNHKKSVWENINKLYRSFEMALGFLE